MPSQQPKAETRKVSATPGIPWSAEASRDRLSSTLFIAGLLHGVILLGVTFTDYDLLPENNSTSLEVVLITNEYEQRAAPEDADILAQQNRVGAGNTQQLMQLKTAVNQTLDSGVLGPEQAGAVDLQHLSLRLTEERPTIVARSIDSQAAIPDLQADMPHSAEQQQRSLAGQSNAIEIVNKPEDETLISDTSPNELIISANTREARIAAYLSRWKNRIEHVGTLNFPQGARSTGLARFPTLEVAIDADGALQEVLIRQSSGLKNLDQAAINIVTIAAPFDPIPEFLRAEYDVLRFAYEWRFTDGYVSNTASETQRF
jgi:protein TonB